MHLTFYGQLEDQPPHNWEKVMRKCLTKKHERV